MGVGWRAVGDLREGARVQWSTAACGMGKVAWSKEHGGGWSTAAWRTCWGAVVEKYAVGVHGMASNHETCTIWSRRRVPRALVFAQTAEGRQRGAVAQPRALVWSGCKD